MQEPNRTILEYLYQADFVTASEIAESAGLNQLETQSHLEELREQGLVDWYRSGYPLKWGINDSERAKYRESQD